MKLRRIASSIVVACVGAPFVLNHFTVQSKGVQISSDVCSVTISGRDKADKVPSQDVWEAAFRQISTASEAGSRFSKGTQARIASIGNAGLQRAAALRRSLPTVSPTGVPKETAQDREVIIAEAVLDARDTALRELSEDESERLTEYARKTATDLTVTLPVKGRITKDDAGLPLCRVDVTGRDFPHLLPEHQVWRFMFESMSLAVDYHIKTFGRISPEYLRLLNRSTLRGMPANEIEKLLLTAKETTVAVATLSNTPVAELTNQGDSYDAAIQRTVLSARERLLRMFSIEGWRALQTYVDEYRVGVKVWYTAPIEP